MTLHLSTNFFILYISDNAVDLHTTLLYLLEHYGIESNQVCEDESLVSLGTVIPCLALSCMSHKL